MSTRRLAPLLRPQRMKGWQLVENPRKDGKTMDKFYIHKASMLRCRSRNEVDDFVLHGWLPQPAPKKKGDQRGSISNNDDDEERSRRRELRWEFHDATDEYDDQNYNPKVKVFNIRFLQGQEIPQDNEKDIVEMLLREYFNNLLSLKAPDHHTTSSTTDDDDDDHVFPWISN
ncbi:hypothetical protein Dimus_025432 [Dionaea muscipula]